jgi:hypothetical protein
LTPADETLLVGRVTNASGELLATLVNYACHPTTLGGANRLISPDYVGAMRELVEEATGGAPCLFLNGASGDLAPRRQYTGRTEIADQNGRQLGYAALSTLSGMLPPESSLQYQGFERSSTNLGRWECSPHSVSIALGCRHATIELPLRERPCLDELQRQRAAAQDAATIERLTRLIIRWQPYANRDTARFPIWLWTLGDAVFVATPAEMHSPFQQELRRQFPDRAIVVMNIVNGSQGYAPPQANYAKNTYQCQVTVFAAGCHERILESTIVSIEELLTNDTSVNKAVPAGSDVCLL